MLVPPSVIRFGDIVLVKYSMKLYYVSDATERFPGTVAGFTGVDVYTTRLRSSYTAPISADRNYWSDRGGGANSMFFTYAAASWATARRSRYESVDPGIPSFSASS